MRRALLAVAALVVGAALKAESIAGAGATFPAPLYQRWIETFLENRAKDQISYDAVGSGQGIARLLDGRVDFAGSDVCDPALSQKSAASRTSDVSRAANVLCVPVAAGAVVPIFNLIGVTQDLRLTPELLADIYLGKITQWNDPKIRAVNRAVPLSERTIVVVHRSDASGTTYAFSEYLSRSNGQWRSMVGKGMTLPWPTGNGVATNDGVAKLVQQTDGAIGYVELLYAIRHRLGVIMLRNRSGRFVKADLETVGAAAAAANTDPSASTDGIIADGSGAQVYPLSTFTYILLLKDAPTDPKRKLLLDFLTWSLDSGQRQAAGLGYVELPPTVAAKARASLAANH